MSTTDERVDHIRSFASIETMREGETIRAYFERTTAHPLTPHEEETVSALERIQRIWDRAKSTSNDATAIIRRDRDTNHENILRS